MSRKNRNICLIILFTVIIVYKIDLSQALENYNGYGGYVIGDHRLIGLAGAYLAKSNDFNAINYNPAGLVFAPSVATAGVARGKVDNTPTDYDRNGSKDSFPLSYWFGGIVGRTFRQNSCVNIALGLVYNTPYTAEQDFSGKALPTTTLERYNLRLAVNAFVIPVALQITPNLSLGLNCNIYSTEESIAMKFPVYYPGTTNILEYVDIDDAQRVSGTGIDLGLLYKPSESWSFGAVFKPGEKFCFEEKIFRGKLTGADTGIRWYRNVTVPKRGGMGIFYQYRPNCGIEVDTNYIGNQKESVLVGSGLVGGIENYTFKDKGVWDLGMRGLHMYKGVWDFHLGGNYLWKPKKNFTVDWRLGTYFEPSRVTLLESRWHYTGGFQVSFARIMLGFGIDSAQDYTNMVSVVGLLFRK